MITISCRFSHSFKIMSIPQPGWADVILLCTNQAICSVRGDKIGIVYIRCIDGREPEAFELWAFSENRIREVHLFARVQIRDDFTEDTFYTEFFNARQIQINFLGRRSVNGSAQWLDDPCAAPKSGSFCQVATWTENTFVYSWGPYPTVIPPNVSTIRRHAIENVPVNPQAVERDLHAQILQDIRDGLMLPHMTTAGSKSPTLTDKLQTISTM